MRCEWTTVSSSLAWTTNPHSDNVAADRKTKMKSLRLKSLLARDNRLIEQKLQSDWKKIVWALRKAWQHICWQSLLFRHPWSQKLSDKKIKMKNFRLKFLLARENHLIGQKLQSDRKKTVWALRKAWQHICRPDFCSNYSQTSVQSDVNHTARRGLHLVTKC